MFSKESGSTIRLTDMEFTFIKMEQDTKENGRMISSTVKEKRFGQITLCMRAITTKERNMEKDYIFGRTDPATKEIGSKIELKELESINGKTVGHTLVNGRIITCMEKAFIHGPMVEDIKASMKWTKSMGMEFTNGLMAAFMKDTG